MIDVAVTLWAYALVVTAALLVGVVTVQALVASVRRSAPAVGAVRRSVRGQRPVTSLPAPCRSADTDRQPARAA